jgi:chromosome segregation ATPase
MTEQMSPEWLRELEELADLGLPVPPTRFRGLKRVVVRLCWVFLHRQVEYNHEVIKSLERVVAESERLAEESTRTVDELRQQVEQLQSGSAVQHEEVLSVLRNELGALREEVARAAQGLSNEQVRSGVLEGQAADLSRSLLELEGRVAGLAESFAHAGATAQGLSSEPRD